MDRTQVRPKILLAACGSVATLKYGALCRAFSGWTEVAGVVTKPALRFVDRESLPRNMVLHTDEMELSSWNKIGDPVLHNDLQQWADIMIVAPMTANTLAKMAGGMCDNLLTCTLRAWDYSKPVFIAPCMNRTTWGHPLTQKHLTAVQKLGSVIYVQSNMGAMAETNQIFSEVVRYHHATRSN